ncbi:hypothetical protein M3J09_013857 [Ascochyta lentis]
MFALGPFLDTAVARTKLVLESGMLDMGKQWDDSARRLDTSMSAVHESVKDVKWELRTTAPAVQHGLSSLGEGLTSLHESFKQVRGTLQRIDDRLPPQPLADVAATTQLDHSISALHVLVADETTRLRSDLQGSVTDNLRSAVVGAIQDTLRDSWTSFSKDVLEELQQTARSGMQHELERVKLQHELDNVKQQLDAEKALSALHTTHHQQVLDAQTAVSALECHKLREQVARLTAQQHRPYFSSDHEETAPGQGQLKAAQETAPGQGQLKAAQETAPGQGQLKAAQETAPGQGQLMATQGLAALQATRHEQGLKAQLDSSALEIIRLQKQVARLTTQLNAPRPSMSSQFPADADAPAGMAKQDDKLQLIRLEMRQLEQTLTEAKAEYKLKEKAATRQVIRLKMELAAVKAMSRARHDAPTAPPAAVPYDDVERCIKLLESRHELVVEQERSAHALERQQQRSAWYLEKSVLLKRCFRLTVAVATATQTESIPPASVQQVLDLQDQWRQQIQAELHEAKTLQEQTACHLDTTSLAFAAFRASQQDKEQKMHTRLRELTHLSMVIMQNTDGSADPALKAINLTAKRGLGLDGDPSPEGDASQVS